MFLSISCTSLKPKKKYFEFIFHQLYIADLAKKPLFYVPGNNDSLYGNYQPFSKNGTSILSFAPEWHGACLYCNNLLLNDAFMFERGYYSTYC